MLRLALAPVETLRFGAIEVIVKADARATAGALTVFEEVPPVADTPLHVHSREDELFYVLEGDHVVVRGEEELRVGPGAVVFLPKGIPHAHRRGFLLPF